MKYLQVVCPEIFGGQVGDKFRVGEVIKARATPGGNLVLDHRIVLVVCRSKELSSPGRRVYLAPGIEGLALVETIKGGRLNRHDTNNPARLVSNDKRQSRRFWRNVLKRAYSLPDATKGARQF